MVSYGSYADTQLINLVKAGDETAFDEAYKRYWKKLYSEAYKRLRSAELCEEVIQDVFADFWVKREEKQIIELFPYLLTAVRYQVYMLYKKGRSMPVFEEPLEYMAQESLQADSLFCEKELKASIEAWLTLQPEKRREIFKMRFMQDLTTREISEILGVSQKTVQNQLLTATASLRASLGKIVTISAIMMAFKVN
ncbi:MAG: sigma-70 family RNA polymerase sigma factor [Candidatus Pedobacter colombiensis]|uniref:Sigma-70 family RNA polymerase sigma factor n=1 Tax=Candidatus Pedobacter colombiensis TaxID=3121371 RepID=A0AAJ6B5X4_9SPHI|nr:sigma-70 family RNA polymerase sigma factor [Pedobacter sp.]WEK18585.1 MAG: sigma-70 family RNA polymerase sigma factor [Pedobacter sp.]